MKVLILLGFISMELFFFLRTMNNFGDSGHWTNQKNAVYSLLSYLNVTKYPPSLLYSLITIGPAMIFLAVADKPLNAVTRRIVVFGRVPFFLLCGAPVRDPSAGNVRGNTYRLRMEIHDPVN